MKIDMAPLHYLTKGSHRIEDNIQNQNLQNIKINRKEKIILESNGAWIWMDEFV